MKKKANKQSADVHVPVTMISYSWKGNISLPRNKIYTLFIKYPLSNPAKFDIKTGKNGMGIIELIGAIGKVYKKIYEIDDLEEKSNNDNFTYGVWGHDIGDLNLSGINVDHVKKQITIDVDS